MALYCVNKEGDHEVHNLNRSCGHLPITSNRMPLGSHLSDKDAMFAARQIYKYADACWHCMDRRFHTK